MNNLPLPSSQCVVWCWPWSSLCWICLNSHVFPHFFFFCFFFYDVFQSLPSIFHILHHPVIQYTIKKQFHTRSPTFLQVHPVLLSRVLIQRCITLKLYFSKMYASFIICFLRNFFQILWKKKKIKGNFP